uniref:FecR family protein n=1 Tax=uncultured Sphingomonas sp. TaxID=158754 RepID=UPI0035CA41B9
MTRIGGFFAVNAADTDAAEAAAWLAQHTLGTIDEAAFRAWRDSDVAHAIAFARALAMWDGVDAAALAAMRAGERPVLAAPAVSRRHFLQAASAVLAVGIVAAGTTATRAYAWSSASTSLGQNKRIRLPDGSAAALNTDSRLSWRFSASERTLWIERGEVALDLRQGPAAIVHGDERAVRLSEGRFNVRLRGEALDLLVESGRARVVGRSGPSIDARSGISSVLVSQDAAVVRRANGEQVDGITAWQRDEILFQDATLGSAVEEYNRFLPRKIVIVDRELASIPVGGRFTTSDPTAFLHAVSSGLNVRVSQSPTAYLLTR